MQNSARVVLLLIFVLVGCAPTSPASAQPENQSEQTQRLWFDVSMGPSFVDWFNRTAGPEDIARIDHLSMVNLLEQIEVGQRLVIFKSIVEAEEVLPAIVDEIEIIGYNLESGPGNLPSEQQDPLGSVRQMRELADRYDVKLAVGPDHDIAVSNGAGMAAYADMMILQIQRVQTEPERAREFVLPLARQMRQVNPGVEVSIQVAAEGDIPAVAELIRSMMEELDGLSILTDHERVEPVDSLVTELQIAVDEPESQTDLSGPSAANTQSELADSEIQTSSPVVSYPVASANQTQTEPSKSTSQLDQVADAAALTRGEQLNPAFEPIGLNQTTAILLGTVVLSIIVGSVFIALAIYMRSSS